MPFWIFERKRCFSLTANGLGKMRNFSVLLEPVMAAKSEEHSTDCSDDYISISSLFPKFKLTLFHVSFLWRVKINSLNWSVVKLWLFISQLVEYCSANAEAMGSNPVEALKIFFGLKFAFAWIAITPAMITSQFHLYSRNSNQLHFTLHFLFKLSLVTQTSSPFFLTRPII